MSGVLPDYRAFRTSDLDQVEFLRYFVGGGVQDDKSLPSLQASPRRVLDVDKIFTTTVKRSILDFKEVKLPSLPIYANRMRLWKDSFITILSAHGCDQYLVKEYERPLEPSDLNSTEGAQYVTDQKLIWTALKQVTLGHPSHSMVKNASSGVEAWDKILSHHDKEGKDQGAQSAAFTKLMT